jgi:hypothetical protein
VNFIRFELWCARRGEQKRDQAAPRQTRAPTNARRCSSRFQNNSRWVVQGTGGYVGNPSVAVLPKLIGCRLKQPAHTSLPTKRGHR